MNLEPRNDDRLVEDRITTLESECRRLRIRQKNAVFIAVLAFCVSITGVSAFKPAEAYGPSKAGDEMTVQKLTIADVRGRPRIELSVVGHDADKKDTPSIRLFDEQGKLKAELCSHPEQTALSFYRNSGDSLLDLLLSSDQTPTIRLEGEKGALASLSIDPTNRASFSFGNEQELDNQSSVTLTYVPNKGVLGNVKDPKGADRVKFAAPWDKMPSLQFLDAKSKVGGKIP